MNLISFMVSALSAFHKIRQNLFDLKGETIKLAKEKVIFFNYSERVLFVLCVSF